MIRTTENLSEKKARPLCQATGCFDHATVYIVLKETEVDSHEIQDANCMIEAGGETGFDGFKIILYLCRKHDDEFKYLILGSELNISKRCYLAPEIR